MISVCLQTAGRTSSVYVGSFVVTPWPWLLALEPLDSSDAGPYWFCVVPLHREVLHHQDYQICNCLVKEKAHLMDTKVKVDVNDKKKGRRKHAVLGY